MASELLKNRALIQKLKEPEIPVVKFNLGDTGFEELITLPEPKPQELLDIQEENRKGRLLDTLNKIGGGLMDESVDFIEREELSKGTKRQITDEEFIRLFKNFSGTDIEFAEFLNNKNIRPGKPGVETGIKGGGFTSKTVFGRRNRLGLKANVEAGTSPKFEKQYNERNKVLTKLVAEANAGDKYVSTQQLVFKAEDELGMKPRYDTYKTPGGKKQRKPNLLSYDKNNKRGFPVLNELDTPVEKVDKVIKDLLTSDSPQAEGLTKTILKKTGISQPLFIQIRDKVPSYKAIKIEAERLPLFLNKANNAYLLELPLAEQLKEVNTLIKGNPAYTYGTGKTILKSVATAKEDAMKYALRNWNLNKGQGEIKFFDAKGKLIPWQKGTRLKYGKVSFEYNGKKYNTSNLTPDTLKKDFNELYETRNALNKFRGQKVPNPFKKGQTIPVEKLIRKIQVDGYGWSPSFSTLEILHGTEGVKGKPFTDLRFNTKDINMVEGSLAKNLASGKLSETEYKKAMANVNKPFAKEGEQAIINRITKQAEQIKKGKFYGFDELVKEAKIPTATDSKNIAKQLAGFGFKCSAAEGGACDNPMNYLDDIKKQQVIAQGSGNAAANAAKKLSAGRAIFREVLGPAALGFELAAAVPITYLGYKAGLPPARIISDATYGLAGETETARLKKIAVKEGIDTADIQKALDFEKASGAMMNLAREENQFRGPDDEMLFPQQYEKGEEDFYKAVGAFRDKEGNISKEVFQNISDQLKNIRGIAADEDAALKAEREAKTDLGGIGDYLTDGIIPEQEQIILPVFDFQEPSTRMDFSEGSPKDPSRRTFLKFLAGIASLPIVGKFFKGAKSAKVVKLANTTTKMPDWFPAFVDRAFEKGIAKKIDVDLTELTIPELPGVKVEVRTDGKVRVEGKNAYNEPYQIEYEPPGYEVLDYETGQTVRTKGDFEAVDTQFYRTGDPREMDYDVDFNTVKDVDDILGGDSTKLEGFAKGTNKEKYTKGQKAVDEADAIGEQADVYEGPDIDMSDYED